MSSLSPIGGNGGPEGPIGPRNDEIETPEAEEENEFEERVSNHAESVIAESSESILRTTSSEKVNEDLQQHISIEESPQHQGFLGRIRNAVASIWRRRILRRSGNYDVRKAEEKQGITEILQDSKMPSSTDSRSQRLSSSCLNSIRDFFAKIFHFLRDAYYRNCTRSGINFCGARRDSLEVLAAVGLLLRMATLRSFDKVDGKYEERLDSHDSIVIDVGKTLLDDVEANIEHILSSRIDWSQNMMLGFSRGLVQLCATPYYANSFECLKSITNLEKKDPKADYSQALLLASEIDRLAERDPFAARNVLDALRFRTSELLGELITMDILPPVGKVGRGGVFPPVNEHLVVQIVNANVEHLYTNFMHDQRAYRQMINTLVQDFFFLPSEKDPSSVGNV